MLQSINGTCMALRVGGARCPSSTVAQKELSLDPGSTLVEYEDLTIIYPKPFSIYLRGTLGLRV